MSSVPFLYVNVIALFAYVLMLAAFLAARKTPEIKYFIVVLLCFILWTGGSLLMRLRIFPGVNFWFYVSIVALFSIALLLYYFAVSFTGTRGFFLKLILTIGTVIIDALTLFDVFLSPPAVVFRSDGSTVFTYTMRWPIIIPCIFLLFTIMCIAHVFYRTVRTNGIRAPGIIPLISGCVCIAAGNMAQIIPGNIFPWDTLSGIVFAALMMYALYKKRLFRLTLVVSRSVLLLACSAVCIFLCSFYVAPVQRFLLQNLPVNEQGAATLSVVLFSLLIAAIYSLLKKIFFALFSRDEQQQKLLQGFSRDAGNTLSTNDIITSLVAVIRREIAVGSIYVCLREGGEYASRSVPGSLSSGAFSIPEDSVLVNYIKKNRISSAGECFLISDIKRSPLYRSVWENERRLIETKDIKCIMALTDDEDIVGLILLPSKERGGSYSTGELDFLDTLSSIASIAFKNAVLYERVYREARIDSLTGAYSFKYFVEKADEDFNKYGSTGLALICLDVDDLKLYNQLYGTSEGDYVLKSIADILIRLVGDSGTVFRHSGKVFAVLMPDCDARRAHALALEAQRQVSELYSASEKSRMKSITLSGGICVSPYAASSANELINNADLAVFNAKNNGKGRINIFKPADQSERSIVERAMATVERSELSGRSSSTYSSTVFALTAAIDAKDHYTYNHSQNVAFYSVVLATSAGLNDEQIRIIYEAALLHDIGKISIPETILCKEGNLTDEEFEIMKGHVNGSIEMIRHLPSMDYIIPAVVGHHERWDGRGYPRGISGEDIPVSARCLAIADSFDAMTTDRPYRKGLPVDYACDQIEKNAGTQFDPELASLFVELIQSGQLNVRSVNTAVSRMATFD